MRWNFEMTAAGERWTLRLDSGRIAGEVIPYQVGGYYTTVFLRSRPAQFPTPKAGKAAVMRELQEMARENRKHK